MANVVDVTVTDVTLAALSAICEYRYLTVNQVAVMVGLRPKSASEMLLSLERKQLLGWFGNTGIRGYGKTPKLYFLKKRGYVLLTEELESQDQPVPPFRQINMSSRWSPLMFHRVDTLDVLAAVERDCNALSEYRLVGTLVEYRREKRGTRWQKETTDYVAKPLIPENKIVPDAGFAVEHVASGKRALFLVEVDCGTTRLTTSQTEPEIATFTKKLAQYDRYLAGGRIARRHPRLGAFNGFHLLTITTSDQRVDNMRAAAATLSRDFHQFYRFSTLMSEKLHAVAQQNNRPFVQVAAWIKRRTYRSRTLPTLVSVSSMAASLSRLMSRVVHGVILCSFSY